MASDTKPQLSVLDSLIYRCSGCNNFPICSKSQQFMNVVSAGLSEIMSNEIGQMIDLNLSTIVCKYWTRKR